MTSTTSLPSMQDLPVHLVEHGDFTEVVVTRDARVEDYNAATEALVERHGLNCVRLWCLPPDLPLDGPDLASIARHSVSLGLKGRAAIVAPSDLAYGLARVHVAHREASETLRVFRNRTDALTWLFGPAPS